MLQRAFEVLFQKALAFLFKSFIVFLIEEMLLETFKIISNFKEAFPTGLKLLYGDNHANNVIIPNIPSVSNPQEMKM